jgi:thiol-disulfide isomerase/thioredoxin
MRTWISCVLLAGALMLGACNSSSERVNAAVKTEKDRKMAPSFSLKDQDGKTVTLADYKGKVVLLNFWATWCGPCKIEIPWFIEFEQKYRDQGFAVLGVAMDEEGWEAVKPYLKEKNVTYRTLLGSDSVAQLYGGVDSLPTTFLVDRTGKIASAHVGLVSKSEYQNEIVQLLKTQRTDAVTGGSATRAD